MEFPWWEDLERENRRQYAAVRMMLEAPSLPDVDLSESDPNLSDTGRSRTRTPVIIDPEDDVRW